jgi:hypothetical protein
MNAIGDIHWLAVLAAAVSAFLLGGLWYGPLFLKPWARASGIDPKAAPGHPAKVFGTAFVCSLLAAAALAFILPATATIGQGAMLGVLIGLFFVAMSFGINYAFSQRPALLWLIDGGYHVVQFALYGLILAAWR